jgi:prepilin-type N-terminal cleavage/methylation domain-containing protein
MVARNGFSLVEVIVALTLLCIVAVAVAASVVGGAQIFRKAELQEKALRTGESLLDSLLALPANGAGTLTLPEARLRWSAADSAGATTVFIEMNGRNIQLVGQR